MHAGRTIKQGPKSQGRFPGAWDKIMEDVCLREVLLQPLSPAQLQQQLRVVRFVFPLSKSVGGTWTGNCSAFRYLG